MTKMTEKAVERVTDLAMRFKQELEDSDFVGNIQFYADKDDLRAILFPEIEDDNRWEIEWSSKLLAATIPELTEIVAINDSYHADSVTKVDGSAWKQGDMAYAMANKTPDSAFVRECLTYVILDKDSVTMASLPYERNSLGKILYDWNAMKVLTTDNDTDGMVSGAMVDLLRKAFETPKLADEFERIGLKPDDYVDTDLVDAVMLCAGVKMILEKTNGRFRVMVPARTDKEAEYITQSFSEPGYVAISTDEV